MWISFFWGVGGGGGGGRDRVLMRMVSGTFEGSGCGEKKGRKKRDPRWVEAVSILFMTPWRERISMSDGKEARSECMSIHVDVFWCVSTPSL